MAVVDFGPPAAIWSDCGALRRMTHWLFGTSGGDEIIRGYGTTWITLLPEDIEELVVDRASRGLVLGSDE